jgi:hypothetical protein
MNGERLDDDQRLLDLLEHALRARNAVPDWFITSGKASFAWHGLDAELAQLSADSVLHPVAVATRAEPAEVRALTFAARELTIEVEIGWGGLRGQLVPQQRGELELEFRDARTYRALADELGYFAFDRAPATSF